MPDGTEECGIILARLEAIEAELLTVKAQLDRMEKKSVAEEAFIQGQHEVYAQIGKRVTIVFAIIGACWALLHWWIVESEGSSWSKYM